MKKLVIAMMSILLVSTSVFAQQRQRPSAEDMAKRQTEHMAKNLSLTDEQKAKIEAINLKYGQKMEEMIQAGKEEREAKMELLKKNRDAKDTEFKEVLTPEQYTQYQQNQANFQQKQRQHDRKTRDFEKREKNDKREKRNKKAEAAGQE